MLFQGRCETQTTKGKEAARRLTPTTSDHPLLSPASNAVLLRGVKGSGRSQLGRGQGKETAGTSAQHSLTLAQGFTFPRRFHSDRREVHQCLVLGAPRTVKGCASSLGFSPQEYPFHR